MARPQALVARVARRPTTRQAAGCAPPDEPRATGAGLTPLKPWIPELTQGDIDAFLDALLRNLREGSAAFRSTDPADQARRSTVLFPFTNGFNCLNQLLRRASWIKAKAEVDPPEDMKTIYVALRQDGALNSGIEQVLHRLNSQARNALTHR